MSADTKDHAKDSLERLRSLERLNQLFIVLRPVNWMAFAATALLIISIVAWGLFGVMADSVSGSGIFLDSGGLARVVNKSSGRVSQILVEPGARVEKGDIIAIVEQNETENALARQLENMNRAESLREVLSHQSSILTSLSNLYDSGNIVAPASGIISDINVTEGDYITAGSDTFCTIRRDYLRGDMRATMYFPARESNKIKPGMVAQITTNESDPDRDGYLIGVVRKVGAFPVDALKIRNTVGNADLAASLLGSMGGAAVEVIIDPMETDEGYLWTSVVGNPPPPLIGGYCTGQIVINRLSPLERLFYRMGDYLRVF